MTAIGGFAEPQLSEEPQVLMDERYESLLCYYRMRWVNL